MIANLTSFFISSRFQKEPIYEALAHQDGIHLPSRSTSDEFNQRTVAQIMRKSPPKLSAQMRVEDAVQQTRSGRFRVWPVVDNAYFLGIVTREALESANGDGRNERTLSDLVEMSHVPHVHADHALHLALERMGKYDLDVLPVIHRADIHKLEGVVTLPDVLDAYGIDRIGSN